MILTEKTPGRYDQVLMVDKWATAEVSPAGTHVHMYMSDEKHGDTAYKISICLGDFWTMCSEVRTEVARRGLSPAE